MVGTGAEERAPKGPAHALERLVFFSDAVFAIAITLLVIEIHVPKVHGTGDAAYLEALAEVVPGFIGFFTSFFVIGAFWAGHHRAFDCASHWSGRLYLPNLLLLFAVAAMPFFTAFSSQYFGERVPTMIYTGWMFVMATCNMLVQRIATAPPIVDEAVSRAQIRNIRHRGFATMLGAATAIVVSYYAPRLGQVALVSIVAWRHLLNLALPR